jgi:hypothetical protein
MAHFLTMALLDRTLAVTWKKTDAQIINLEALFLT